MAEISWKVGDRVRMIEKALGHEHLFGQLATIVEGPCEGTTRQVFDLDPHNLRGFYDWRFERAEESPFDQQVRAYIQRELGA